MLGKLQTDNLERRFGQYRQLSGSNYNISVQQVLESEKKLRVLSLLELSSSKLGSVAVTDIREALSSRDDQFDVVECDTDDFVDIPIDVLDCKFPCDEQVLTYISGFVVHKYLLLNPCQPCASKFVFDRQLQLSDESQPCYAFISCLDRSRWS